MKTDNHLKLNLTKPLAFIDLETTGINVMRDRIVEIAILKVAPDGSISNYTRRVNPTIPIPEQASAIHGIYDKDVQDKSTFRDIAQEVLEFIGDADMAGFNSNKFDIPLLGEEFLRAGIDFTNEGRKNIDIQSIFHKKEPRNLSAAYKFYCNKDLIDAHSAEADITATYNILLAQLQLYDDLKNEVDFLHEYTKGNSVDLSGRMVYDKDGKERFNFGKYKGKLVEEVLKEQPQYYDWIMKSEFAKDTKRELKKIWTRISKNDE